LARAEAKLLAASFPFSALSFQRTAFLRNAGSAAGAFPREILPFASRSI
jgi:hypothetical protein